MSDLKREGKIRAIGISVRDRRASEANVHIEAGRVDVIQTVYNFFEQEPEYTLFPLTNKHHVGIIARCPFSSGSLTGTWNDKTTFPKSDWRTAWTPHGWLSDQLKMVDLIKPICLKSGISLKDIALKYVLNEPTVSSVIPGSSNPIHIRENASVSGSSNLPTEVTEVIKQLWIEQKIHGTYNGS